MQDNSLRAAAEHAVLQEEVRSVDQRDRAQDHGRHGGVQGSVAQQEAQEAARDHSGAGQLHEPRPAWQRCRLPHLQPQPSLRHQVIFVKEHHSLALSGQHARNQGTSILNNSITGSQQTKT